MFDAISGGSGKSSARARPRSSISSSVMRGHLLTQALERPGEPRLHGARANPEYGRGLGFAQIEEVTTRDDEPMLLGEPVDGLQREVLPLATQHGRLGGRGRPPGGSPRLRAARARGDGQPNGGGCVPRWRRSRAATGERACHVETGRARGTPHEGVVSCLLRVLGRSGDQVGSPKRNCLVHTHELLVGGHVSLLSPSDEFSVVYWSAHQRLVHRQALGRSLRPPPARRDPGWRSAVPLLSAEPCGSKKRKLEEGIAKLAAGLTRMRL